MIGAGFVIASGRAVELAVAGAFAEAAPVRVAEVPVRRGEILDRNGQLLAGNLDFHSLFADPRQVWDAADTARQLATVLPDIDVEPPEPRAGLQSPLCLGGAADCRPGNVRPSTCSVFRGWVSAWSRGGSIRAAGWPRTLSAIPTATLPALPGPNARLQCRAE